MTLATIADALNALQARRIARGRSGCLTKAGGVWRTSYIWKVLRNPFYIGRVVVSAWDVTSMFRLNAEMAEADRECQRIAGLAESQSQQIVEWQQTILALQRWDDLSAEEQQALVMMLVYQVEVDLQGNLVAITWTAIWDQLASM